MRRDTYPYGDGNYTLRLTAMDKAGNRNSTVVTVTVDNTAPAVDFQFPPSGSTVSGVIEIVFGSFDRFLSSIRLFIDDEQVASGSDLDKFSWNTSAYDDGPHVVRVEVEDEAGNVNSTEVNVSIDNTPPRLNVTELTRNPTVQEPRYTVRVSTERNATVRVNGAEVRNQGTASNHSVTLSNGTNVVTVVATDRAGNNATWSKTRLLDGDGLNDGKEMGRLNTYRSGSLSGERYYYLQSYPSTDVEGAVVIDSGDSDGDGLDDLAEYDFGSDGMRRDTDGDRLDDSAEKALDTDPTHRDTDMDGLTDWTEVNMDQIGTGFSDTDPTDNDTDGDGALDGGEINAYRYTFGGKST